MSEDEAIHTLQLIKQAVAKVDFEDKTKTQITRAIETILDLYQKQKEKDLEYILNCMKEINNNLMNDLLNGKQKEKIKGLSEELQ